MQVWDKEKFLKLIGILIILFIISHFIPTSYYLMSPGIARELSSIITVSGGFKDSNRGDFLLTAVSSQKATVWDFVRVKLFNPPGYRLQLMKNQLPAGVDMQKYISIMGELMEESKLQAQAVAFNKAGYNVKVKGDGARVVEVLEKGAARGKLKKEDIIYEIDGKKVDFATDAVNYIREHKIGDVVEIKILRNDKKLSFNLETVELENNPGKPSIGVLITTKNLDFDFPRQVKFETDNIVGPSAGGVFALEIYNQLTEKDITHGLKIAGTGTINREGEIGRIDGVRQKVMAAEEVQADIFLAPAENYEEAKKAATAIRVISVKNFDEALSRLEKLVKTESNIKLDKAA